MQIGDDAWMTLEASGWRARALKAEAALRNHEGGGAVSEAGEARLDAAARALYKAYEETTDEDVARVWAWPSALEAETREHWQITVREMREWAAQVLAAADAALASAEPVEGAAEAGEPIRAKRLHELLAHIIRCGDEGDGLYDCVDNYERRYQSADLAAVLVAARAALESPQP